MNTTRLIRHWSMGGALSDDRLRRGVGSAVDIHAAVSAHEAAAEQPAPAREDAGVGELLVKPAGGGDWQLLLAGSA